MHEGENISIAVTQDKEELSKKIIVESLHDLRAFTSSLPPGYQPEVMQRIHQMGSGTARMFFDDLLELLEIYSVHLKNMRTVSIEKAGIAGKRVFIISAGYLAFYRLWASGERAEIWSRKEKGWIPLPRETISSLNVLWRMKNGRQPPAIAGLPVLAKISDEREEGAVVVDEVDSRAVIPAFSVRQSRIIYRKVATIKKQLASSPLSLLVGDIPGLDRETISFQRIDEFLRYLGRILLYSEKVTRVSSNDLASESDERKDFLFLGPFSMIADGNFYYRNSSDGLLRLGQNQPDLENVIQAETLFRDKTVSLLPLDLFGTVKNRHSGIIVYFFNYGQKGWPVLLAGFTGLLLALVTLFRTLIMLGYIKKSFRSKGVGRMIRPLRIMYEKSKYGKKECRMELLHEMLAKEQSFHEKVASWIIRLLLLVWVVGTVAIAAGVAGIMNHEEMDVQGVMALMIPFILMMACSIVLLASHALVLVFHRVLLPEIENAGWQLLFGNQDGEPGLSLGAD